MKFILQGDLHIRSTRPVNRKDDYYQAQFRAFKQLIDFANEHDADILCGGDLTDTPELKFKMYNAIQEMLSDLRGTFYTCTGNHDLYYHNQSTIKDTAIWGWHDAGFIEIVEGVQQVRPNIFVLGAGWEQKVTGPVGGRGKVNILMAHIPVFEKEVPFYFKHEAFTSKTIKETYPGFDYYFCSDIHVPFVKDSVIVSGSMMRQTIDQMDFKPRCYLLDTRTGSIEPLFYKIADDVFSIPDKKITPTLEFEGLLKALKESTQGKVSYKQDCETLAAADKPVKNIIKEIFDDVS